MWFLVLYLNGQPAKNIFPLIRQKTFLKITKKGGMARDVTNRGGGVRGGIPPGIHTYHHHLQKPERSRFHFLRKWLLTDSCTGTVLVQIPVLTVNISVNTPHEFGGVGWFGCGVVDIVLVGKRSAAAHRKKKIGQAVQESVKKSIHCNPT